MAGNEIARSSDVLQGDLSERVAAARLLVVGAGGIGCELLKTLVLCGFSCVQVVREKSRTSWHRVQC